MGLGKGMTKILFAPLNYSSVVQTGWYDAFRETGAALEIFDYMNMYQSNRRRVHPIRQQFLNKAMRFKPDLIFLQIQHTSVIDQGTLKKIKQQLPKTKIVNWTSDVRSSIPETYKKVALVSDLNLIPSTGQLEMYRKNIPKPVDYLQIGYNPELHYPEGSPRQRFKWDVSFIAHFNRKDKHPLSAERERLVRALRSNFGDRFALYGDGWRRSCKSYGSINQKSVNAIYHNSVCVVSWSHYLLKHYFSDRLLMAMASGRPVISQKFSGWESYFAHRGDILMADSVPQVVQWVRWCLKNPEQATFIGQQGARKVKCEHTYGSRIKELFDKLSL